MCTQGSTVDRQASEKEKSKDLPTYKDNDFVNDGMDIIVGDEAKEKLLAMLQADIDVGKTSRNMYSCTQYIELSPFQNHTEMSECNIQVCNFNFFWSLDAFMAYC